MYKLTNYDYPPSLAAVGKDKLKDPWGNPYQYTRVEPPDPKKKKDEPANLKDLRKDRNEHPINTDYDLYSAGKDGKTNLPITSHNSQDDVIRAKNGAFVGLVSDY
jgi:general secretion pathway protein G